MKATINYVYIDSAVKKIFTLPILEKKPQLGKEIPDLYPLASSCLIAALAKQECHDESLPFLSHAIQLNPKFPETWCNRGDVLGRLGRLEGASLKKAKEKLPDKDELASQLLEKLTRLRRRERPELWQQRSARIKRCCFQLHSFDRDMIEAGK